MKLLSREFFIVMGPQQFVWDSESNKDKHWSESGLTKNENNLYEKRNEVIKLQPVEKGKNFSQKKTERREIKVETKKENNWIGKMKTEKEKMK